MFRITTNYLKGRKIYLSLMTIGAIFIMTAFSTATIINIPDDYSTIQAGIDASNTFDTVLVAPGHYVENVNFKGKNIVLTSHFMFDQDTDYIFNTIIDGSNQSHPDTGSAVLLVNYEATITILQGFTITGGTGTLYEWQGGSFDRVGGGIYLRYSTAIVQYNYIYGNNCNNVEGIYSGGGGGIKVAEGSATIRNNIIAYNEGPYGAGIGIDHCNPIIKNNVIAYNSGGSKYSGSGIQINVSTATIENNTFVGNVSPLTGAAIRIFGTSTPTMRNNLIWYNEGPPPHVNGYTSADYCNIEINNLIGTGNISVEPHLDMSVWMYPYDDSQDIDGGDPSTAYYDVENPGDPGTALWPAYGSLTNDIGAYGGPGAFPFHPARIYSDVNYGLAPLSVSFEAQAGDEISNWIWDFDDGDSGSVRVTSHVFDTPGQFDVVLAAVTTANDTLTNIKPIYALADTIKTEDIEYSPSASTQIEAVIELVNNAPAREILLPVEFGGDIELEYNSYNTTGCRTDGFTGIEVTVDGTAKTLLFSIKSDLENPEYLPAGSGPVLNIVFDVIETSSEGTVISLDGFDDKLPNITSDGFEYTPETDDGNITLAYICGDSNMDGSVNIADASYIINAIFFGGNQPDPIEAADANADGSMNIADASYLVNYIFFGGNPPCYTE